MTKVATFAINGTHDKADNLRNLSNCIEQAARAGAELVVLPEIALQGYRSATERSTQADALVEIYEGAESVPDGRSVTRLGELAVSLGVYVVYGLTEKGEQPGVVYNTAVLTGPEGFVGRYRKVHVGIREQMIWTCGTTWPVFDTSIGRIGLLICYDKALPESARELALGGADLLVMPTAWPEIPMPQTGSCSMAEQYDLYERARALENNRWFISANFAGQLGTSTFFGLSQIIAPNGSIVATSGETSDQTMVLADIDVHGGIAAAYASFNGARLVRDRHPETYRRLALTTAVGCEIVHTLPDTKSVPTESEPAT